MPWLKHQPLSIKEYPGENEHNSSVHGDVFEEMSHHEAISVGWESSRFQFLFNHKVQASSDLAMKSLNKSLPLSLSPMGLWWDYHGQPQGLDLCRLPTHCISHSMQDHNTLSSWSCRYFGVNIPLEERKVKMWDNQVHKRNVQEFSLFISLLMTHIQLFLRTAYMGFPEGLPSRHWPMEWDLLGFSNILAVDQLYCTQLSRFSVWIILLRLWRLEEMEVRPFFVYQFVLATQ